MVLSLTMNNAGKYIIFNTHILPATEFDDQLLSGLAVYEIIRVIDGIPLFFEDHLSRLFTSVKIARKKLQISKEEIESKIMQLIRVNEKEVGNIEIIFSFKPKIDIPVFMARFVPHFYPDMEMYQNGVKTSFLTYIREKPNAKTKNLGLREMADSIIKKEKVYEVILIDKNNCVLEGSRSNVFFIRQNSLFTAPVNHVLAGITRKKIFEICHHLNIEIIESQILVDNLKQFQSMFISGTSPSVLPVKKAGSYIFDVNNRLLRRLMFAYAAFQTDYIEMKKRQL